MAAPPVKQLHFKVVVIGDASVGKSCLAYRFCKGEFNENMEPSIGATFMTQVVDCSSDSVVKFEIWDTAGQERYKSITPMYMRGASVAVVVFDITAEETYDGARNWVKETRASTDALIALVGNKCDLRASRTVPAKVAEEYAASEGILYMETSAKTNENVQELFTQIGTDLLNRPKDQSGEKRGGAAGARALGGKPEAEASQGGCCS